MLLEAARSQVLVVDMQERLLPAMSGTSALLRQAAMLARAATRMVVPVAISEHCADKIGATHPEMLAAAPDAPVLPKRAFSCMADEGIAAHLSAQRALGRDQIVICGIEAHVCVGQTALAAQAAGYAVFVVVDAIASREPESRAAALARLRQAGIVGVTVEMALFEWLGNADAEAFRDIHRLLK